MVDTLTPEQRRRCMQANRSQDTSIELILRRALFAKGLRYRLHARGLPGRPDIVFFRHRLAIFVDGDFWHGYHYSYWKDTLSEYWSEKISENRRRDQRNFARLRRMGWVVIRIWEHDVHKNLDNCVKRVEEALRDSAHNNA